MLLKAGARILALNGAPFRRNGRRELIIGLVARMGQIEGALSFEVSIDGDDATENLIRSLGRSKFADQVKVIATNGIALGGLNIMDFEKIAVELGVAVVSVTRKRPRRSLLRKALSGNPQAKAKNAMIERNYKKIKIIRKNGFYVQLLGIDEKSATGRMEEIISLLRTTHMIASGIGNGESRGRA